MRRETGRTWAVIRREFGALVQNKMFIIGTLLLPVIMAAFVALPVLLSGGGGGERHIVIVDGTEAGLGDEIAAALPAPGSLPADADPEDARVYRTELVELDGVTPDTLRSALRARIAADSLDGFLWLPAGLLDGGAATYESTTATNFDEVDEIDAAVERAAREYRLRQHGIEPAQVVAALRPVGLDARKYGEDGSSGSAEVMVVVANMMGLVLYLAVMLYGQMVMRGVMEEKRDRIAEIAMSSIRASQLMLGKLTGIGGAGILQLLIWLGFAAALLMRGEAILARFGVQEMPPIPQIPLSVGVILLLFFTGGYILYSAIFAAIGAMANSDQEAQQLVMPAMAPIIAGFFMMFSAIQNPNGTAAVLGSMIPFTSPIVMPVRATITEVPLMQVVGSVVLMIATTALLIWLAAKIYRVGMLATGKRPSMRELVRWVRAA